MLVTAGMTQKCYRILKFFFKPYNYHYSLRSKLNMLNMTKFRYLILNQWEADPEILQAR